LSLHDALPILTQPTTLGSRVLWLVNKRRLKKWLWWCLAVLLVVVCVFIEFQTSVIQSWIFTSTNERISFAIAEGASSGIAFPRSAPFDDRRGYSKLPGFESRLEAAGYKMSHQVRQSVTLMALIRRGVSPPYGEPPSAGPRRRPRRRQAGKIPPSPHRPQGHAGEKTASG